jgi:DNA repair and recombination protein RAD54B
LKKKKAELASLGRWKHINCLRPSAAENVKDQVLRRLLYSAPPAQASTRPPSGRSALLDALDRDDDLDDEQPEVNLQDLPGGTISFLFEKGADEPTEEDVEDSASSIGGEPNAMSGSEE